jgi:hypothetical protein
MGKKITVRMSKRRLERLLRADKLCREFRWWVGLPRADWGNMFEHLFSWMRVSGKDKYVRPRLRERNMRGIKIIEDGS